MVMFLIIIAIFIVVTGICVWLFSQPREVCMFFLMVLAAVVGFSFVFSILGVFIDNIGDKIIAAMDRGL